MTDSFARYTSQSWSLCTSKQACTELFPCLSHQSCLCSKRLGAQQSIDVLEDLTLKAQVDFQQHTDKTLKRAEAGALQRFRMVVRSLSISQH